MLCRRRAASPGSGRRHGDGQVDDAALSFTVKCLRFADAFLSFVKDRKAAGDIEDDLIVELITVSNPCPKS